MLQDYNIARMEINPDLRSDNLPIKSLQLWDENARFPDKYYSVPESELIDYFLTKKDYKIRELAEAIVKDFSFPQIEKLVVFDDGEKLIVLEGNRRLTVYKLLANPELITKDDALKKHFEKLRSQISITEDYSLECLVTSEKDVGYTYIDRKHAQNNNEVNWGDTERAHYNKRRGKAKKDELFKIAIAKVIKDLDIPERLKEQILGHGFVTTFYRIITSKSAMDEFKLDLDDTGNLVSGDPDFLNKLKVIIFNVLRQEDFGGEKVNSRTLNKNEQIEKYVKSVNPENVKTVDKEIKANTETDMFGAKKISIPTSNGKRSFPKSVNRSYLIPSTCTLQISKPRINDIYRELKSDLLLDDTRKSVPNAVGVLFRVFIEVSIDYFLEKEGVTVKSDTKLAGKITKVSEHMETNGIATKKQLVNIRKVAIAKNSILSIDNFHDFVHSFEVFPGAADLKAKWDSLQEFFEVLWNYILEKEAKKQP